eukprot:1157891-Pelagomonas_calceolata.AAC.13
MMQAAARKGRRLGVHFQPELQERFCCARFSLSDLGCKKGFAVQACHSIGREGFDPRGSTIDVAALKY